jgi:hypothetical protein
VIELPNVVSLKGFLVRRTPWSIRRWFYAHVLFAGLTRLMTLGALTAEDTGIIAILTKIPGP